LNPSNQGHSNDLKNIIVWRVTVSIYIPPSKTEKPVLESITRHQWISEAAYFKAEARGFVPGRELDDWLEAENEFSERLISHYHSTLEEDGAITIRSLQQLAEAIGVQNPARMSSEIELIHALQIACRHRPCFRFEYPILCKESDCKWRAECRKLIALWYR
jgi:hypothetical protein